MSYVQANIRKYRLQKDYSYSKLSELSGIPKTTLFRYETSKSARIPIDAVDIIERALSLPKGIIMGWSTDEQYALEKIENIVPIETQKIPLLGTIAAGEPIYADEDFECYVECGVEIQADFALRVKGESMINARINDGDIVFIRKQPVVSHGEIAAVLIDDDATLKRFKQYGNHVVLQAENHAIPDIEFDLGADVNIRILGKAIAFQSDVR